MKTVLHRATESLWNNIAAARCWNEDAIASLFLLASNPSNPPRLVSAAFDALYGMGLIRFEEAV